MGGKGPAVSMETESHQLTPCFPLVPPTTDSLPSPSQPVHLSILHPSISPPSSLSLFQDHTSDTFLSHTSASPSSASLTLYTNHTLGASPSHPHGSFPFYPLAHVLFFLFFPSPHGCSDDSEQKSTNKDSERIRLEQRVEDLFWTRDEIKIRKRKRLCNFYTG